MNLAELRRGLLAHAVQLSTTTEGKLRYDAPSPLPVALVEGMKAHRAALLRQVQEGRLTDGRLDTSALHGRCASCGRWQGPDEYGDGLCLLGRAAHGWPDGRPEAPVLTTALHQCGAHGGKGWAA